MQDLVFAPDVDFGVPLWAGTLRCAAGEVIEVFAASPGLRTVRDGHGGAQ
jgi:hypothetical protein